MVLGRDAIFGAVREEFCAFWVHRYSVIRGASLPSYLEVTDSCDSGRTFETCYDVRFFDRVLLVFCSMSLPRRYRRRRRRYQVAELSILGAVLELRSGRLLLEHLQVRSPVVRMYTPVVSTRTQT